MSLRLCAVLLVTVLVGCAPALSRTDRQLISTATANLADLRSTSEQWAHRIKSDFPKGSKEYETAYTKYILAKAGVDSWLDRLSLDLTTRNNIASSDEYQVALHEASTKAAEFSDYARGLYDRSLTPPPNTDLLPSLTDIGFKIWDKYRSASTEVIDNVKKSLQSLKWKAFGDN